MEIKLHALFFRTQEASTGYAFTNDLPLVETATDKEEAKEEDKN